MYGRRGRDPHLPRGRHALTPLAAVGATDAARLRGWLAEIDGALAERFWQGGDIGELLRERADRVDELVVRLWDEQEARLPDACLVAVGGYGRGMLHPHSDVDLLVLLPAPATPGEREAISAILTRLWDIGLEIGHGVRTLEESLAEAQSDLTVMTTLMESRLLAGPLAAFDRLYERIGDPALWPGAAFFRAKREEQAERYRRFGDSAYNLEPHVKEGPGGLRDIQMLDWVALRAFGDDAPDRLVAEAIAEPDELAALAQEERHLWRVRYGLHLLAGRREDRILFDFQRELARRFGYRDGHGQNLAVEQLMQRYFRTVSHIERIIERILQAFEERLYGDGSRQVEPIDEHFELINGYLAVRSEQAFFARPPLLMEMFVRLAERPAIRGVRADTVRAIRRAVHLVDDTFRADPRVRAAFLAVLRSGGRVADLLARMHRYDILGRYLPVFGAIAGRMQYDLFHIYTVDEHTLTVIRRIDDFRTRPDPQRFPMTHELVSRLHKPELLYLAGLFHDIAKGRSGDHSELGALDAEAFCEAHGLSAADTRLVVWLVEQHLLMSTTAQKADISDPEVVNAFARKVANVRYLKYLYLLTCADIAGTSPKLWNSWKAKLLIDLYHLTREALDRGFESPARRDEWIADTRAEARELLADIGLPEHRIDAVWKALPGDYFLRHSPDEVAWHTHLLASASALPVIGIRQEAERGSTEVFVCAEDLDGTFATIVAGIGQLALDIIDARVVNTTDGRIVDTFLVLDEDGRPLDDARRVRRLADLLRRALTQRPLSPSYRARSMPRRLRHFLRPPRLRFDERDGRTRMDLFTSDRPGLLARLASVFLAEAIRVHGARIATFGDRVEDHFVLSDLADQPLGEAAVARLERAIEAALEADVPDEVSPLHA